MQSSDNMLEELWCREVKMDEQVLDMPPTFDQVSYSFSYDELSSMFSEPFFILKY